MAFKVTPDVTTSGKMVNHTQMSFFLHAFHCPPKVLLMALRSCYIHAHKPVQEVKWHPPHTAFLWRSWVTLVITCSAFAIGLPAAVYFRPPSTLHRCCSASCSLPLVVSTPSPFTRCQNLPCTPVLLPLLLSTTFSAQDPLREVPAYLTGHRSSFACSHQCLQLSDAYWRRKNSLFPF